MGIWINHKRQKVFGIYALIALGASLASAPLKAEEFRMGLDQARAAAQNALAAGDPVAASQIAALILSQFPKDAKTHALLATSQLQTGQFRAARKEARLSFSSAKGNSALRYDMARLAALAATNEKKFGVSKYWLRRASDQAQTPHQSAQVAKDFSAVNRFDPWERRFAFSMAPSNNVNGGSSSDILVIDGVSGTGRLSGDAQALSGIRATVSGSLGYRLAQTQRSITQARIQYYGTFHKLTAEAKALAPSAQGKDYNFNILAAEVIHRFSPEGTKGPYTLKAGFSQRWYGGDQLLHSASIDMSKLWLLGKGNAIDAGLKYEREIADNASASNAHRYTANLAFSQRFGTHGSLTEAVNFSYTNSDNFNADQRATGIVLRYTPDREFGPMRITFGIGYDHRFYPKHFAGLSLVPGGRNDHSFNAAVDVLFTKVEVMGFSPLMTLRAVKTNSNVSRYDSENISLGVSLRSSF